MADSAADEVKRVLQSGYIGQGGQATRLEHTFGAAVRRDVVLVNSCTSAIDLALHMCEVGPGDEVVTTPITCTATNSPIVTRGAIPVWADVDLNGNIVIDESMITHRTKAIIAVDWGGRQCDYDAMRNVMRRTSRVVPIIQDAAHCGPLPLTRQGDYICWSFQAIKFLTTGDGGALSCPSHELNARARLLRWYGLDRNSSADFRCAQNITEVGYKYHMNDIAATIGIANLELAQELVRQNRRRAARYFGEFYGYDGLMDYDPDCHYWLYTLRVRDRVGFQAYMKARKIETSQVHARNDKHTAFPTCYRSSVDLFDREQISIPITGLTLDQENHIVDSVIRYIKDRKTV